MTIREDDLFRPGGAVVGKLLGSRMQKGARILKLARFKRIFRTPGLIIAVALCIGLFITAARLASVHGVYSVARYVDVNSGDELRTTRLFGFKVNSSTEQTEFSRLVRLILKDRPASDWRFMSSTTFYVLGRELADGDLSGLASDLDLAARLMELGGSTDASKKATIENLLVDARTGNQLAIRNCLDQLMNNVEDGANTRPSAAEN